MNKVSAVVRKQNTGVVRMVTGGHHRDLFELVENRNTEAYITAHAQVAGADRAQAKKIRAELRIVQLLK